MKSSPILDAGPRLRQAAEITRLCLALRDSYLATHSIELLALYQSYRQRPGVLEKPDANALLLGFRQAWIREDYEEIVLTGDRVTSDFLARNRELEALLAGAGKRRQERR